MVSYKFLPRDELVDWLNNLLYDPNKYISKLKIEFCKIKLIKDEIMDINIYDYDSSKYQVLLDFVGKNDPYNNNNLILLPKDNLKSRILFKNDILYVANSLNSERMGSNIYCFNNIEENAYNKLLLKLTI